MGAQSSRHQHERRGDGAPVAGMDQIDLTGDASGMGAALLLVSTTPISPFSPFWQTQLNALRFSALNSDAETVADTLDNGAISMEQNTPYSGNFNAMLTVLCMALEQYPTVLLHHRAAATAEPHESAAASSTWAGSPEPAAPAEPLHEYFSRTYPPYPVAPRFPPTVGLTPSEARRASQTPTPDWMLNLIFLARVFLQHIMQMEYGEKKARLLALRPIAQTVKRELDAKQAAALSGRPIKPVPLPPIHSDLSYRLVHALLSALTDIPLSSSTYELHLELSSLVLVLFSSQIYVPLSALYASSNAFLGHALLGSIASRAPELVAKLLNNATIGVDHSKGAAAAGGAGGRRRDSTIPVTPGAAPGSQPVTVSAMSSPAHGELRSGNVSPMVPMPAQQSAMPISGSSLSARIQQIAGPLHQEPQPQQSILKRLGSRLVSILLFPVQLYQYFFSGSGLHSMNLSTEPLALRCNLLLLLLVHNSLDSFRTLPGEVLEDEHGEEKTVGYGHAGEREFDWRRWRDEGETRAPEQAAAAPYVPSAAPSQASSIRATAPPVQLHVSVPSASPPPFPTSASVPPAGVNPYKHALASLVDEADGGEEFESPGGMLAATPIHGRIMLPNGSPTSSMMTSKPIVSFAAVYELLTASTASETSVLLLYSLIHSHRGFKEFILVKSDIDLLVLPWLAILYEEYGTASGASSRTKSDGSSHFHPNRVYMLLILLLILSRDRGFVENIHRRLILKRVPFWLDNHLANISLGSTMMLVLMKVIQSNLYEPRDHYVHTNCLAILSNIAQSDPTIDSAITGAASGIKLHPSVCLKLIALLSVLSKKYAKLVAKEERDQQRRAEKQALRQRPPTSASSDQQRINLAAPSSLQLATMKPAVSTAAPAAFETVDLTADDQIAPPAVSAVDELSTFSSFIRLLLELLLSFLSPQHLSSNVYLLYSLMQSSALLEPFRHHAGFWESGSELQKMCAHFQARLEMAQRSASETTAAASATSHLEPVATSISLQSMSIDALMQLLKSEVRSYRPPASSIHAHTLFSYEEQARSEEFFIPYVWNVLWRLRDVVQMNERLVVLFTTSEDEEDDGAAPVSDASQPSAADTDTEELSHDDRRLAAEMEQVHLEASLQEQFQHADRALRTPLAQTPQSTSRAVADMHVMHLQAGPSASLPSNASVGRGGQ
jgi:hypothetical protein